MTKLEKVEIYDISYIFTYGVACGAIRSINGQSVVVVVVDVVVVPS